MLGVRTLLLVRDTVRVSSTCTCRFSHSVSRSVARSVPFLSARMSSSESCRSYEVCSLQSFLLPVFVTLIYDFLT